MHCYSPILMNVHADAECLAALVLKSAPVHGLNSDE